MKENSPIENSPKRARIYSIVNQKGGVGKTTTAINLATGLALNGKKTLVIDMDPQGNASTGFGIAINERQKTIYEVLTNQFQIKNTVIPTKIKNLKIITSTVDLSACEVELVDANQREYILRKSIKEIVFDYDVIIIDCPPSLGLLTINSLVASDSVLIPMQCEFFSLEGLSHLLTTLDLIKENLNHDLTIAGIILTMHDKRNKLTEQVENDVREYLQDKVFKIHIPRNIRLSEAPSHGLPGIIYDPKCSGSSSYINLAKEVIDRENL